MSEIVEHKSKVSITAEKPVPVVIRPRFVKVAVSGYRPFFMNFEGDADVVEKAFLDTFGVELEAKAKREPKAAEEPKKRRGRKPKAEAVQA